ncbi:hypothetical protein Vadar_028169 [Vaccinium darrowii]|uniref:Uncharacterized protein n=1 Tax=Vaccinium darrowii TaxID=229202 RepID=A0ACB7YH33_9ERIC|nr:hypothetical protein Vadar_028169 [Vaccinium darrowii]
MVEVLWKSAQVRFKLDQEREREREELKNVGRDTPKSSSTNLKEHSLSKVLCLERHGRERGLGTLSQVSSQVAQLNEENAHFKSQMVTDACHSSTYMVCLFCVALLLKSVNTNPHSNKCKLLDWMGTCEVVIEGHWSSSDPNALVHNIPIGPNAMRVWVDVPKKFQVYYLWRNASEMTYIEQALGTTVAWTTDKVIIDSTTWSMA